MLDSDEERPCASPTRRAIFVFVSNLTRACALARRAVRTTRLFHPALSHGGFLRMRDCNSAFKLILISSHR